ncbi:hypothetical protein AB0911_37375 [Streptomyces nigra]
MRRNGVLVARCTVERLMRELGSVFKRILPRAGATRD